MNACNCNTVGTSVVRLDSLMRHMIPFVVGLPHPIALNMLRESYKDFAQRSGILEYNYSLDLFSGVQEYDIECMEGYLIFNTKEVFVNGTKLWSVLTSKNYRCGGISFVMPKPNRFFLFSTPSKNVEGGAQFIFSLVPDDCAINIPSEIATIWGEAIAYGAMSRAFGIPKQAWTDPREAKKYEMLYRQRTQEARALVNSRYSSGSVHAVGMRWI